MKIYNIDKTKILTEVEADITKGYLVDDKILIGTSEPSYITEEIPNGRKTTFKPAQNIYENIKVYIPYIQQNIISDQIEELEEWFDTEYRYWFEKCIRKIAIGTTLRDGTDPKLKLSQLYAEAETKANRINELKALINN